MSLLKFQGSSVLRMIVWNGFFGRDGLRAFVAPDVVIPIAAFWNGGICICVEHAATKLL